MPLTWEEEVIDILQQFCFKSNQIIKYINKAKKNHPNSPDIVLRNAALRIARENL